MNLREHIIIQLLSLVSFLVASRMIRGREPEQSFNCPVTRGGLFAKNNESDKKSPGSGCLKSHLHDCIIKELTY